MPGFRFRLEKALELRHTQLGLEEAGFKRETKALAEIERRMAECEASEVQAEQQVRVWGAGGGAVSGADLEALGAFRLFARAKKAVMEQSRAEQRKRLKAREEAMLEARRRCKLLEKLKERRAEEWKAEENRALEEVASESFLAKWRPGR